MKEDLKTRVPGFLWTLLLSSFPLADFSGYPFTVICCSHEYDYTLALMGLSGESSPLGMVLGLLIHTYSYFMELMSYIWRMMLERAKELDLGLKAERNKRGIRKMGLRKLTRLHGEKILALTLFWGIL